MPPRPASSLLPVGVVHRAGASDHQRRPCEHSNASAGAAQAHRRNAQARLLPYAFARHSSKAGPLCWQGPARSGDAGPTESDSGRFGCRRVRNPVALSAIERHLFAVYRKKVMAEELAKVRQNVAHSPDHRIVAAHGIGGLKPVNDELSDQGQHAKPDNDDERGRKPVKNGGHS